MKFDWDKISVFTEATSAVAIVVTLGYLAIQTQQNTEALLANTRNQIIDSDTLLAQLLVENPEVELSMYGEEPLDEVERVKLENWLTALVRTREYQWIQYQNGLLDKQTWEAFLSAVTGTLSYPRTRYWWNAVAIEYFDDGFVDELNRTLENFPVIEHYESPIKGI